MATTITKPRIGAWGEKRILRDFGAEIRRRGGVDVLCTMRWATDRHWTETPLAVTDRRGAMVLLHASQWHQAWKKAPGRIIGISYLCGHDDNGLWAASVPGTVTTVDDALDALTPAEVARREHVRQGDVYMVRMERANATSPSGTVRGTHLWDAETRTLTHVPTKRVKVKAEGERRAKVCRTCGSEVVDRYIHIRAYCPLDREHTDFALGWVTETRTRWESVPDEDAVPHEPVVAPANWPGVKVVEQNQHSPAHPTVD